MANVTMEARVKRGPESWAFIYIVLGFALTVEGNLIGMVPNTVLPFPSNILTYLVVMAGTAWLFVGSGWFQNRLIGLKNRYESKAR